MKIQDLWKLRKTISLSKSRSLRTKLFKFKNNGSQIRLSSLQNRQIIWVYLPTVRSSEHKNPFSSKRNLDLIHRFKATKKKLDSLRLPRKTLILKWINWMIYTIRTPICNKNWKMITSILKMSLNKSLRSLKMKVSDLRIIFQILRNKKLIF